MFDIYACRWSIGSTTGAASLCASGVYRQGHDGSRTRVFNLRILDVGAHRLLCWVLVDVNATATLLSLDSVGRADE